MITTRLERLEQLLTENCKKALAEIEEAIQRKPLEEYNFDGADAFNVPLRTALVHRERALVKEVLELSGWRYASVSNCVHFYY